MRLAIAPRMDRYFVLVVTDRRWTNFTIPNSMEPRRIYLDSSCMRLHFVLYIAALVLVSSTGCTSNGSGGAPTESTLPEVIPAPAVGLVTMKQDETTLGYAVRLIGEQTGGGLVLVNGVEDRLVGPFEFNQTPRDQVASRLAVETGCAVEFGPYYHFVYPPGYESLVNVSLQGRIPKTLNRNTEGIAFGNGLPLHMLFVWIGYARGITLVPDHLIADTRSGELAIGDAPLDASLEGIFKSARLVSFVVESADDYLFIRAASNRSSGSQLLNPDALDSTRRKYLKKRATVMLPHQQSDTISMSKGAVELGTVLGSLTTQLGIRVEAERALHDLPVVPAYYHDLPVETILDLLIRQWPVPAFGYHVLADRIVIATRPGQAGLLQDKTWESRPILE